MPIFEYHCNDCETGFEVLERAGNAKKLPKCPSCGT
ncbi:zinc ribbon domain-containing protein, partial [Candidatus Poribacteria bacterium]|nr:zinc ribbon domain-containing protein [Candidatus Poribacteria bacterium]